MYLNQALLALSNLLFNVKSSLYVGWYLASNWELMWLTDKLEKFKKEMNLQSRN